MSKWIELTFKEVPLKAEFGFSDYFATKVDDKGAYVDVSGEYEFFDPDFKVVMEVSHTTLN